MAPQVAAEAVVDVVVDIEVGVVVVADVMTMVVEAAAAVAGRSILPNPGSFFLSRTLRRF